MRDGARGRIDVERLDDPLGSGFAALLAESEEAGLSLLRRLADEWSSEATRFDRPGEALFGARMGRELVGVGGLSVDPYAAAQRVGRVRHLYVGARFRRRGIGECLVVAIVEAARGRFDSLRLRTANAEAARLYERLGFGRRADVAHCTHVMDLSRPAGSGSPVAREGARMSPVTELHEAVKRGHLERMRELLGVDASLANARSEADPRGTYPLHVAAEFGQADAARVLLAHGADVARLDAENEAIALCWAAFFGRPDVVAVLLEAGSAPSQRNKHGLTPLGCALDGARGKWRPFSDAGLADWQRAADILRAHRGVE